MRRGWPDAGSEWLVWEERVSKAMEPSRLLVEMQALRACAWRHLCRVDDACGDHVDVLARLRIEPVRWVGRLEQLADDHGAFDARVGGDGAARHS
eukprot:4039080-Pleurochrysis_carterae.AAC.1